MSDAVNFARWLRVERGVIGGEVAISALYRQYLADQAERCECDRGEDRPTSTWTFFGHWDEDRIVVEYAIPGEVTDDRIDTGYWEQGLWAASASGPDVATAQRTAIAEYEEG